MSILWYWFNKNIDFLILWEFCFQDFIEFLRNYNWNENPPLFSLSLFLSLSSFSLLPFFPLFSPSLPRSSLLSLPLSLFSSLWRFLSLSRDGNFRREERFLSSLPHSLSSLSLRILLSPSGFLSSSLALLFSPPSPFLFFLTSLSRSPSLSLFPEILPFFRSLLFSRRKLFPSREEFFFSSPFFRSPLLCLSLPSSPRDGNYFRREENSLSSLSSLSLSLSRRKFPSWGEFSLAFSSLFSFLSSFLSRVLSLRFFSVSLSLARARARMHTRSHSRRKLFLSREEPLVPSLPLPLLPLSLTRGHARGGGGNLASSTSSTLFSSCGPARKTFSLHLPISFFREEKRDERGERIEMRELRAFNVIFVSFSVVWPGAI